MRAPVFLIMTLVLSSANLTVATVGLNFQTVPQGRILRPLSSVPTFAFKESTVNLEVEASPDVTGWSVGLLSRFDKWVFNAMSVSYDQVNRIWRLTVKVPRVVPEDLYDLKVFAVPPGGREPHEIDYQPRSVQVLDRFPDRFNFVHVSDIHSPLNLRLLRQAISEINLIRPSFVVFSGDSVDLGSNEDQQKQFFEILQTFEVPTFLAPGNRDTLGGTALYHKYFGPTFYSADFGSYHLVVLDSDEGLIDDAELKWAEQDLAQHSNSTLRIVVFHHAVFDPQSGSYLRNSARFMQIAAHVKVDLVLTGHSHRDFVVTVNSTKFIATTTLSGPLFAGGYNGYRLITIDGNRIVRYNYAGTDDKSPSNSIPVGFLKSRYLPSNDGRLEAVTLKVRSDLNETIFGATAIFYLKPIEGGRAYKVFVSADRYISYVVTGNQSLSTVHSIRLRFDALQKVDIRITIATSPDTTPPSIRNIALNPQQPTSNDQVVVTASVFDEGWGLDEVTLSYSFDNGTTWANVAMITASQSQFAAQIPATNASRVLYFIRAADLAGNSVESQAASYSVRVAGPEPRREPETNIGLVIGGVLLAVAFVALLFQMRRKPPLSPPPPFRHEI